MVNLSAPGESDPDDATRRWLDQLLSQALQDHASDLHFEPWGSRLRVRRRVDGLLQEVEVPARVNP